MLQPRMTATGRIRWLATAAGSPGPGRVQACVCGFGRSAVLGAAQRVGWGAGRAARKGWSAVQAGWASLALLAAGADALRAQGRAVACADASSEAHRISGPAVRAL